jgi:hypothetical protein|tara:strand:- start:947 stop:1054 length:108 start_codon:yes stop_codon:yes gene_type:complete
MDRDPCKFPKLPRCIDIDDLLPKPLPIKENEIYLA